jgi:hypothetical protein
MFFAASPAINPFFTAEEVEIMKMLNLKLE